jgi:hypothetical protein
LDAERAIAWRAADSFALREFLGLVLPDAPPDHSTISRTRRLIDLETHEAVFTWMLQRLADAGLVKGKTIGIDATTLEANAGQRSIVRRDTGATYQEFSAYGYEPQYFSSRRSPIHCSTSGRWVMTAGRLASMTDPLSLELGERSGAALRLTLGC